MPPSPACCRPGRSSSANGGIRPASPCRRARRSSACRESRGSAAPTAATSGSAACRVRARARSCAPPRCRRGSPAGRGRLRFRRSAGRTGWPWCLRCATTAPPRAGCTARSADAGSATGCPDRRVPTAPHRPSTSATASPMSNASGGGSGCGTKARKPCGDVHQPPARLPGKIVLIHDLEREEERKLSNDYRL